MNGLEVSHLRKCYGDLTAVDDLSFHVDHGEIFGLIGPNGAGKSTTMLIIIGLLRADGGTVMFDGQRYNPRDAEMRARLGIVPQEIAVYPELTAIQNLQFFGRLQGLRDRRLEGAGRLRAAFDGPDSERRSSGGNLSPAGCRGD